MPSPILFFSKKYRYFFKGGILIRLKSDMLQNTGISRHSFKTNTQVDLLVKRTKHRCVPTHMMFPTYGILCALLALPSPCSAVLKSIKKV